MSSASKWDKIYRDKSQAGEPCWLLQHCSHLLPINTATKTYHSLDVACGLAANALFMAELGFNSYAWDVSAVAIDKARQFAQQRQLTLHTEQRDIEAYPPAANQFDVIIVSQFLHRPLCPLLAAALKPKGLLFYQTFNEQKRDSAGPSNPDFLLQKQELLSLFAGLEIRFYREDLQQGDGERGLRNLSYLIAQKPA